MELGQYQLESLGYPQQKVQGSVLIFADADLDACFNLYGDPMNRSFPASYYAVVVVPPHPIRIPITRLNQNPLNRRMHLFRHLNHNLF